MGALIKGKQIATAADGVATANLVDLAVTTAKLDNLGVTTGKIAANAVTAAKVGSDVVVTAGTNAFAADQSMGGFKLTNLGAPTAAGDAATKTYVDATKQGLDVKDSVRVRAQGNINLAAPGATIDGVAMSAGQRFLADQQTTATQDGVYEWNGAAAAATRSSDAAIGATFAGAFVFVEEGTNADAGFVCTNNQGADVIGTDGLSFTQFSGAGQITAGAGLTKTGDTLDVGAGNGIQVNADSVEVIYAGAGELSTVNAGDTESLGTNNKAARSDHQHPVSTAAPAATQLGAAAGEGTATSLSRSDHVHKANTAASGLAAAGTIGTGQDLARADHQHARDVQQQEAVTTEAITTDTALADTLNAAPTTNASVQLYLNGLLQEQGAGKDYTISGQTITWLAGTGTAVDMAASDTLIAKYQSQG